jgi:F0F1-type ATP synthase membrane subunit b/b'
MSALDDPVFDTAGEHESVALIRRAIELIVGAKPLPLSTSVRIEPDEVCELLEDALERLPEELRQARWLLKEREEFLEKTQRDGDQIVEEARARAEAMVSRQAIVRQAKTTAEQLRDHAEEDARRKKHEAEDWCDQHLARFEIVLERTAKTVAAGREKLRVVAANSAPSSRLSDDQDDELLDNLETDHLSRSFFDAADEV